MRWEQRMMKQVFRVRLAEDPRSPAPGQGRRGVLGRPGGSPRGAGGGHRGPHALSSPVWQGRPTCPGFIHQMSRQHQVKNRNTNATTQKHSFYKVHGAPGHPSSGSSPGPRVAAGPPVPLLAAVGPGLRLEGRNRAQGCPGSRASCGPERGRQTQQKHCFGMKAHGADRRPQPADQPSGPSHTLRTSGRP